MNDDDGFMWLLVIIFVCAAFALSDSGSYDDAPTQGSLSTAAKIGHS